MTVTRLPWDDKRLKNLIRDGTDIGPLDFYRMKKEVEKYLGEIIVRAIKEESISREIS